MGDPALFASKLLLASLVGGGWLALGEGLPPGLSGMKGGLKLPMLAAMKAPEKGDPSKLLGVVWPPTWLGSEVVGGVGPLVEADDDCWGDLLSAGGGRGRPPGCLLPSPPTAPAPCGGGGTPSL